jgi:hypothetical protein
MYAGGEDNKEWQSCRLENLCDSVGMVIWLYSLGILNEVHVLPSKSYLVSARKFWMDLF